MEVINKNKEIIGCYKCHSKLIPLSNSKSNKYPVLCPKCNSINRKIVDHCYLCNSKYSKPWGKPVRDFYTVECKKCGLVYLKNPLTNKNQNLFYSKYMTKVHQKKKIKVKQRAEMYKLEFNFLSAFIGLAKFKRLRTVLDVGCGGGFFLDLFKKNKFKTFGTEVGQDSFNLASRKHKMYYGEFNKKLEINKKFDLIVMRGVVEHVKNPKVLVSFAKKLIKKDGYLFITATPNLDSVMAEMFKERWTQHRPESHILHLKEKHLDNMIEDKNFKKIASNPLYLKTPYENFKEDIKKIYKEISLNEKGIRSTLISPPFFGNMITAIYKKS